MPIPRRACHGRIRNATYFPFRTLCMYVSRETAPLLRFPRTERQRPGGCALRALLIGVALQPPLRVHVCMYIRRVDSTLDLHIRVCVVENALGRISKQRFCGYLRSTRRVRTYIHAYIHTYIHTYIQMPTYILTYPCHARASLVLEPWVALSSSLRPGCLVGWLRGCAQGDFGAREMRGGRRAAR